MTIDHSRRSFVRTSLFSVGATVLTGAFLPRWARATEGNPNPGSWSDGSDPVLRQKVWDIRFTNSLPWALDPTNTVLAKALNVDASGHVPLLGETLASGLPPLGFIYKPDAGKANTFSVKAGQTVWPVLGPLGGTFKDGTPIPPTTVWGYGNHDLEHIFTSGNGLGVTFPGRSFVVTRGVPITVNWYNNLVDSSGRPLPHLVGVDQTISMQADGAGQPINGVPIAMHQHGGDNQAEFDGGPDQWFTPQRRQIGPGITGVNSATGSDHLSYSYPNTQEASLHWYHDHGQGVTRINAYAGLAGLYVVRDANEAALIRDLVMPTGPYELPLVIQDKIFQADGSIAYTGDVPDLNGWNTAPVPTLPGFTYDPNNPDTIGPGSNPTHVPEMFGDILMVNGVAWPNLQVEPRQYRLRLLNGSDSRVYNLSFGGLAFWQIGTDLGLLNKPVPMNTILLFPGERKDVLLDFSTVNGRSLLVTNDAPTPYPSGDLPTPGTDTVFQIQVNKPLDTSVYRKTRMSLASSLRGQDRLTPDLQIYDQVPPGLTTRQIMLGEGCDEYGRIMPLMGTVAEGTKTFDEPADIFPALGTTEVWEFWNSTVDSHPIHMHLVQVRIINRQPFTGAIAEKTMVNGWFGVKFATPPVLSRTRATPAPAGEQGWKDTFVCPPGQVTRILVNFPRTGKFVYHCHILGHEEHDMMRWYQVK